MADKYTITTNYDEIKRKLENIPKAIRDPKLVAAARKAATPIRSSIRNEIKDIAKQSSRGDDYSRAGLLMRNVKVFKSKSKKAPGVTIYLKGLDIPMYKESWNASGFGVLMGEGSYKKPGGRYWKTRSKKYTGKMKGFGNFFESGFNKSIGQASAIFENEIDKIVKIALYNG